MKGVRVGLAQISPRLGDLAANLELHLSLVERARGEGTDLLVFPELSLTGYHLLDQVPEVAIRRDSEDFRRLESASREIDLVVGFVEESPGHRFFNAAGFFSEGRCRHVHRKIYLPDYGLFQEGRDFARGERLRTFRSGYGPAGLLICEDLWHPTTAWLLAQEGAEMIFVLSSSPTRGAKPGLGITSTRVWRQLLEVSAHFQTAFFVYVNRVGCEDGLTFGGASMVVDPFGRVIAQLPPLEEGLLTVELEPEVLRRARIAYPLLRDERMDLVERELNRIRRRRYRLAPGAAGPLPEHPARPVDGECRTGECEP